MGKHTQCVPIKKSAFDDNKYFYFTVLPFQNGGFTVRNQHTTQLLPGSWEFATKEDIKVHFKRIYNLYEISDMKWQHSVEIVKIHSCFDRNKEMQVSFKLSFMPSAMFGKIQASLLQFHRIFRH